MIDSNIFANDSFFDKFIRRIQIMYFMFQSFYDVIMPVKHYGELVYTSDGSLNENNTNTDKTESLISDKEDNFLERRLALRIRACYLLMKICHYFNKSWACRQYSIMKIRAYKREGISSALNFEVRLENGKYIGHISAYSKSCFNVGESGKQNQEEHKIRKETYETRESWNNHEQSSKISIKLPFEKFKNNGWHRG